MSKIAYINISENEVQLYIGNDRVLGKENFFKFELKDLTAFIRAKGIKKAFICQYLPDLITFKFTLPFTKKSMRKKKILDSIVMGEIKKRYPAVNNFSFTYELHEGDGGAYIRCYFLGEENFDTVNKLIMNGLYVKGFYPNFMPLVELLKANGQMNKHQQIICLLSGKSRYLFVLNGEELILQRSFESSEELLNDEDVININMTVSYCIQNLRIKPEKVIFIGTDRRQVENLSIPCDFMDIPESINQYILPYCLLKFQKKLKGKEFFLSEYKKYISTRKYTRYALLSLISASFLLLSYNLYLINEINKKNRILNFYRNEIAFKESYFFQLQEKINYFERNLSPYIRLQNRKNSQIDPKVSLYPISEATKVKNAEIKTIDIENKMPQKVKISGKISGNSFTERQTDYLNFKSIISERGLKISDEKWDITNGDFIIEGEYEFQRILQK